MFLVQDDDLTLIKLRSGPIQSLSSEYSIVHRPQVRGGGRAATGPHSILIDDLGPAGAHAPEMNLSERQFWLQKESEQTVLEPLRLSSSHATIKEDWPCLWQKGNC
jgi:hypothetical protein